jgi:hypothetical protein
MKYYLLILLVFPLIVGGLELRVIIKNRRRAHEKRKNARHFQHFKETTSPFGVRKIKVVCQDETFLKELVCAAFDIEWESRQTCPVNTSKAQYIPGTHPFACFSTFYL